MLKTSDNIRLQQRSESISLIKGILDQTPDKRIFTTVTHKSKSGMQRCMDVYAFVVGKDTLKFRLTFPISKILDLKISKNREGLILKGCGMNMGAWIAMELSRAIYDDPRAIKQESL